MEKVTGIGGVFFQVGPTAFTPFEAATEYFGRSHQSWMVNFRVRDLAAMIAQLESEGIRVTLDPETYPNGRFARLEDPEGNPIELWEPHGRDEPHHQEAGADAAEL